MQSSITYLLLMQGYGQRVKVTLTLCVLFNYRLRILDVPTIAELLNLFVHPGSVQPLLSTS